MWKKLFSSLVPRNGTYPEQSSSEDIKLKDENIPSNLKGTLDIFKSIYSIPDNRDAKIRVLKIREWNKKAAVLFISTITDVKVVEERIIEPLLLNKDSQNKLEDIVTTQTFNSLSVIKDILVEINRGNSVLFVDGHPQGYIFDTSSFQSRAIGIAESEVILKGPKEAFIEKAAINISLIRKKIRNENLVVESMVVSKRSKNEVFMMYVKDLASDELVQSIKDRLDSIDADAIQNLGLLEQYVEDRKTSLFPTVLYTERPDRAASFLEDGNVILLMDNSPSSLVLPVTFWSFFHNPEEHYLRFPYGNATRALRMIALFIAIFTSSIYISITNYHAEMIPPDLLLAIASTREKVPFPVAIEIFMMEIAFELIREAGLRVPSPIGPTIGIVGALILGQAAVSANIISPIVIIVVALGGLSSFSVSDISMNYAIRLIKFLFIFAASMFGIFGMTSLFIAGIYYMVSIKSFGVPYLSPKSPGFISSGDTIFRRIISNERFRPGYLKPKDIVKKGRG